MKSKQISVLLLGLVFLLGTACTQNPLSLEQEDQIKRIGSKAASALTKNLKAHLTKALAAGNTAEAFEFCAASALDLAQETAQDLPEGLMIKRTTMRPRNPEKAPDKYENDALAFFEAQIIKTGAPPDTYIQYIQDKSEYRYYQPIVINELCLKCHGELDKLGESVRQSLSENYPQDSAIGYKIGDFRGVVRVSIPVDVIKKEK